MSPFHLLANLLSVVAFLILVDVVVSWCIHFRVRGIWPGHPAVRLLRQVTNPVVEPFRRLIPPHKTGGLDLSPVLAIFAINVVQSILFRYG
jgi:YggT family protein